jgi:hypothetical protein
MSKNITHNIILASVAAIITARVVLVPQVIEINHFWRPYSFLFLTDSLGFINILCVLGRSKTEDEVFYQMQIYVFLPKEGLKTGGYKKHITNIKLIPLKHNCYINSIYISCHKKRKQP